MATRNAATHRRTALDSQPLPTQRSQATGRIGREKEDRRISLTDATVATKWLNAAKQAEAHTSYEKVRRIYEQLAELRESRLRLREFGPDPEEWNAAVLAHLAKKKLLKAGKIPPFSSTFPGDRITDPKLYEEALRKAGDLVRSLNQQLYKYVFRPQVSYARLPGSMTILQALWAGGMAPDRGRGFETTINGYPIAEADAALSLVRLDLSGDLAKVGLCEMCHERWRVASKRSYRFCSKECREKSYAQLPDYHERKARTQREYRRKEKLRNARQDAARKGRI